MMPGDTVPKKFLQMLFAIRQKGILSDQGIFSGNLAKLSLAALKGQQFVYRLKATQHSLISP